eukprot:SAG11_NODE_597_length_8296_cov_12.606123_6_plen_94_part_00
MPLSGDSPLIIVAGYDEGDKTVAQFISYNKGMDRRLPVGMRFTLHNYCREQLAEIIRRQFSAKQYDVQCSNEEIASALVDIGDERLQNLNAGI